MSEIFSLNAIFFFVCIWGCCLGLVWFRPRLEARWKIFATVLFLIMIYLVFSQLSNAWHQFTLGWHVYILQFLRELMMYLFSSLLFLWPLALVLIFYKADAMAAERLLVFMCIFTVVLFVMAVAYTYYSKGIDSFLLENLRELMKDVK